MPDSHINTLIVGGGQAGLAVSWHLKHRGVEHEVLDRGTIGDTWRRRWDSFCLVTPNWTCRLPGFPYDGDEPDGFMHRGEIVAYIERYAQSFQPPYSSNVEVRRLSASDASDRFLVDTSDGPRTADNVVVTTGTFQHPRIPAWCNDLADDIVQKHSRDYRNPVELPDGAVLVVGSGQSGCQIAEDLHLAGREVHLCVGSATRIPRRYRGLDIIQWQVATGLHEVPVDEHELGREIRFKPHPHLSGRDGGHTIDLRRLALDGIQLHGHATGVQGHQLYLEDDLRQSLDAADAACRKRADAIDGYIATRSIDAEPRDLEEYDWHPTTQPDMLDLKQAGITSVIYATGFRFDFSWIDLPILDQRGYPDHERGITAVPGLYFVGLHWLHTWGSGLFFDVGRDAEYVVERLCSAI